MDKRLLCFMIVLIFLVWLLEAGGFAALPHSSSSFQPPAVCRAIATIPLSEEPGAGILDRPYRPLEA